MAYIADVTDITRSVNKTCRSGIQCLRCSYDGNQVNDGKKVKHVKLCAGSSNSLVIDENFEAAMKALPGVVSYFINLD